MTFAELIKTNLCISYNNRAVQEPLWLDAEIEGESLCLKRQRHWFLNAIHVTMQLSLAVAEQNQPSGYVTGYLLCYKLTEFREGKNVLCWKTSASSHQGFLTQALTACPSLATGSLFRGLSDCVQGLAVDMRLCVPTSSEKFSGEQVVSQEQLWIQSLVREVAGLQKCNY